MVDGKAGIASYLHCEGSLLEVEITILIPEPSSPGFYVVEGVTGTYYRGAGWETDDDYEVHHVSVRAANPEEAKEI